METGRTWWEYLLLTIVTVPLGIALVVSAYRQFKHRFGGRRYRNRRRW